MGGKKRNPQNAKTHKDAGGPKPARKLKIYWSEGGTALRKKRSEREVGGKRISEGNPG